ncbi:hypothetical protein RB213_007049 [Colletotrichum asianum]
MGSPTERNGGREFSHELEAKRRGVPRMFSFHAPQTPRIRGTLGTYGHCIRTRTEEEAVK